MPRTTQPRPPSAGGAANSQVARGNARSNPATHNVPRPPAGNDNFARGNANSANNHGTMNRGPQGPAGAATARHTVPRPPANYTYHAPSGRAAVGAVASTGACRSMPLRKATRGAVRKATTPIAAAARTTTRARDRAPPGRRPGRLLDTRITQRRRTRLLRDMDRLAQPAATQEETAADRIRQLPPTAPAAAMDRARPTLPAATALRVPIRRRAPTGGGGGLLGATLL